MTAETFFANFGHLADAPNGVQKLRELILQLAVQGKLVPQDPNDEPASVLIQTVQVSDASPLTGENIPFALPASWIWVRLGGISVIERGGSPRPIKDFLTDDPNGLNWIKIGDTDIGGKYISKTKEKIRREGLKKTRMVYPGDFLLTNSMSFGRPYITKVEGCIHDGWLRIHPPEILDKDYLYNLLSSPYVFAFFKGAAAGAVVSNLNTDKVRALPIPIPPLEEQKRIVAKVDQLMALCDELEARQQKQQQGRVRLNNAALDALLTARGPDEFAEHWQRISTNFDLLYDHPETIAKLRAAILQLAVQGKLVPQDPNDEPASVLLERIRAEKERLVKEGKIKKQRPLPAIDEELAPFDLPSGWAWARFPEVGEFGRGKSKHRPRNDPSLYSGGKYPMVQTGDVARANGEIKTYTALYNDTGLAQSRLWPKGTMCVTIAANIADSAVLGFDACFPDSVVGLIVSEEIGDVGYFEYFMRTAKAHLLDFAPSTAQKNINLGILETVFIPVPPLAEMKHIVAKLDQLMALCDDLEAKLLKVQNQSEKLMEVTIEKLLVVRC